MRYKRNIHTLIAENSLATPDCDQSLPTKGMNCPKTSDLKGRKVVKYEGVDNNNNNINLYLVNHH